MSTITDKQSNDLLDLAAYRCPMAMTLCRTGIQQAASRHCHQLTILSIDPMVSNHIKAYINAEFANASLMSVESTPITDEMRRHWLESDSMLFDEDDFENTNSQYAITVQFQLE